MCNLVRYGVFYLFEVGQCVHFAHKGKKSRLQAVKAKVINLLQNLPLMTHDQYFRRCRRCAVGTSAARLMPGCRCLRAGVTTAGRLRMRQELTASMNRRALDDSVSPGLETEQRRHPPPPHPPTSHLRVCFSAHL